MDFHFHLPIKDNNQRKLPDNATLISNILLEEYKTLRTESLNTINNRITIVGFSFSALTIIISATVIARLPDYVVAIVLGIIIPIIARTLLYIWLGEYERSQRAGASIAKLEIRISKFVGVQDVLSWESMLRRSNVKLTSPYNATISLFRLQGYVSELLALYYVWAEMEHTRYQDIFNAAGKFNVLLACLGAVTAWEFLEYHRVRKAWIKARAYTLMPSD